MARSIRKLHPSHTIVTLILDKKPQQIQLRKLRDFAER